MIYQIYGFNILCDCMIGALKEYCRDGLDMKLPTVTVLVNDDLGNDMKDGVRVVEDYADAVFTNRKCCFWLIDGVKIQIVSDNITLSGDCVDSKRVGEEINGPSMIVLSRYHKRAALHGSAFLYNERAYLLLAHSGAGKSTLATAMTKYHKDISFLTDDIIFVEESGSAIFRGMHSVNLNDDSLKELRMLHHIQNKIEPRRGINSIKTTCNANLSGYERKCNRIPLGGIIFLGAPIKEGMIQIQKLDIMQSFCEIVRNIKMNKIMTNDLLMQEMDIINNMLCQDIFTIALRIEHDYAKLERITYELRKFIDGCYCG